MKQILSYIVVILVFLGGLALIFFVANVAAQIVGVVTATGAVFACVFTLVRDGMQRYHELYMQEQNQAFLLGAMSHMANITFDKHVEFCEEYIKKFREGIINLLIYGSNPKCLEYASDLDTIRNKHTLWINDKANQPLIQLEMALRKMGANEHLIKSIPSSDDRRSIIVNLIFKLFDEILEIKDDEKKSKEEKEEESQIAQSKIISHLRELLGSDDLLKIRRLLMDRAIKCAEVSKS